ncbi:MAG: signal peptidase I, partial [Actinomycetota bacterium]
GTMRKSFRLVFGALAWAAASIATLLLALAFVPTLFGFESLVVASGSMGRTLPIGSVALTRAVEAGAIVTGDVISYRLDENSGTTTHRVVAIDRQDGQVSFTTKGDANREIDPQKVVVGGRIHRVEQVVPLAGYVIRYARTPIGGVGLIVVPIVGLSLDRRGRRRGRMPGIPSSRRSDDAAHGWSSTTYQLVRMSPVHVGSEPGA